MKKSLLSACVFICSVVALPAQKFIENNTGRALTLPEIQLQFDNWAKSRNLNEEHHWKYFKRFEQEMQMHTDGKGNVTDATTYLNAAVELADEKNANSTSRMMMSAWTPAGPGVVPNNLTGYMENGIGRINCIAFHPTNPNTYFIGVAQGGVWKTTNNGQSWTPLTDQLPILRISDIAIDPNDPDNTMYISVCDFEYIGFGLLLNGRKRNTHYGLGVYKTTNGGVSWQATGLTFQLTDEDGSLIRKILIDPNNSNNLLACGVSGMYRSTNAGLTWNIVNNNLFWDMTPSSNNPNIIYAASGWVANANAGSAGIFKSTDFGITWTLLNTGIPATGAVQRIKLAVAPSDPNYVYAVAVDNVSGLYGIYKSVNAGTSWTFIYPGANILEWDDGSNSGGQGTYDLALMIHPSNRDILYVGGVNLWGSTDGGQTFNPASHWTLSYGPTIHADIHFLERQPLTGNIFVCNDGGIYRTTGITTQTWNDAYNGFPWPTAWINISNGMQVTSFYRVSSSRNNTGRLMAGAQDNASFYFENGTWSTIFGGDGMDNYLDPLDDNMAIGSSQYGNFYLSYDDGNSDWGTYPNINGESGEWTTPVIADYNNPGTLYIGFQNVVKSTDNGQSWTSISNFPFVNYNNEISALAVANSNANVLYAAKRVRYEYNENGSLWKTTNGGNTWTNITAGLPDTLYITSVDISETDANTVYVTFAGLVPGVKIFKTTDGGSTWQNISYNLPNIPVNCIKYLPGSGGNLIAATDIGVYSLMSNSTTWSSNSTGLPNVIVSDIEFNVSLNKIYVSTFGRGIWSTDLDVFTGQTSVIQQPLEMSLYPTPNNGTFTISNVNAQENQQLEIIDIMGKVVYTQQLSGASIYEMKLTLQPGMYFARMTGNKGVAVKSFIVN
ncbi:MAG: hypothetical protein Fur0041_10140 [Bacteroidia bacterium]